MKYSIAPSALAYLFGDMLEDVFIKRNFWQDLSAVREILPCRRVKVERDNLANVIIVAAFVYLTEEGYLRLILGIKRGIFKSKDVFGELRSSRLSPYPGSLEEQIVNKITRPGNHQWKKNDVGSIIQRLQSWHSEDPCRDFIRWPRKYLLARVTSPGRNGAGLTSSLVSSLASSLARNTCKNWKDLSWSPTAEG